jgi:hypothetical protein
MPESRMPPAKPSQFYARRFTRNYSTCKSVKEWKKYIWGIEDLEAWDRMQERKIQDQQTLNGTQEAII